MQRLAATFLKVKPPELASAVTDQAWFAPPLQS